MKAFHGATRIFLFIISMLFVVAALALLYLAALKFWEALTLPTAQLACNDRVNMVLRSLALLTVAALELGQTILEEEVQRKADMSAPTRVRRFLSRFLVIPVVSLSIETLVLVFEVDHDRPNCCRMPPQLV